MVIELGTALGISTTYLATGNANTPVITVEANSQLCDLASDHFSHSKLTNITLLNNHFDDVLPELAAQTRGNLLVFIDGNHTYDATMRYYHFFSKLNNTAILVFDDIHWSAGIHKAWKEIQKSPDSGVTIDLFQMGIVFQGNKKRNIALWY
jgi:predicted O-methyltransferase YrrM